MRFISYRRSGRCRAGLLDGDSVVPLRGIDELGADTPIEALADPLLEEAGRVALADVTLRPVVPRPARIFCVGLNYREHVGETRREIPTYPVLFAKFAQSLIAAGDAIQLPVESAEVDYEAEVAVVIGRPGRRVCRTDALDHVLGYTIANDVTMRDYQYRTHQWLQGKAWDDATPLGPALVTPDEVDHSDLEISLRRNGERLQVGRTSQLIFDIPHLINVISEFTQLNVGDVILTGTPGGIGYRRDPQVFLRDGDRVEVSVTGLGTLQNPVVAEKP
ncbi:fumarylacetoacetate hydrolase family protein [Rhizomonospora bruguierae]|uniref:fumarylacetoacetate hydrolase family protein n=1 Tax=Rhizomonospora bruguierae TaxID=1581705 RepID=UPI001BCDD5A8|nr:fumarylacetoacetate hydrolase family protein [Micromonospora sp. NBRC 107566]